MRTHAIIFAFAFGTLALAGCGEIPAPARVDYVHDIQPLVTAHCIRCHGAGGTLNTDPDSTQYPTMDKRSGFQGKPNGGDFTGLNKDAAGNQGLLYYTSGGGNIIWNGDIPYMPPPPAPPLTSREREMLDTWIANPIIDKTQ